MVTFVPQHASNAVGVSNVQPVPHSSVRGPLQLMFGGFVSISVTTCVQNAELEQQSVACHVSVMFAAAPYVLEFLKAPWPSHAAVAAATAPIPRGTSTGD